MAHNPIIREHPLTLPVPTDESPHGCYNGWVYMGFGGEDENGEYGEDIERVRCRRCNERRRWVERGG
jgi:hypothetical protein